MTHTPVPALKRSPHSSPSRPPLRPDGSARIPDVTPRRNAVEALAAVLAAFAAMFTVAVLGLYFVDAPSTTSLGSAAAATVCLAVGGSAELSGGAGGGFLSLGIEGSVRAVPLGVTLVGAVAFGFAFFRPLRRRRVAAGPLAARALVAAGACFLSLLACAHWAREALRLPESVTDRLTPGGSGAGASGGLGGLFGGAGDAEGGLGSGLGDLFGGMGGGSGGGLGGGLTDIGFRIDTGSTLLGGLAWLLVVLGLGLLIARRANLPTAVMTGRPRTMAGPAASATTTVALSLLAVLFTLGTFGSLALAGDKGLMAAGIVLLALPNLLLAVVSVAVGVPWSFATQTGSPAGGMGGMLGMLGGMGGAGGGLGGAGGLGTPKDRTLSLASLGEAGPALQVGLPLFVVAGLVLCGALTASRTPLRVKRDGTPLESRYRRASTHAIRLAGVWSALLLLAVLAGKISGSAAISIMGMSMMNLGAHLAGNAGLALVMGLLAGAVAGFAGSLTHDAYRSVRARAFVNRRDPSHYVSSSQSAK
ncbi:streptophobe family protein [Streptomyces sp. NPDC096311]|uniref:streptophobe family protein n=1 Tax=Streptomyces sp. NPDC096311 TaxID=3366083 RepID=UPI00380BBA4C